MRKVSGVVAVIVGLLLVTAAPVVHWVVAPRVTVLPSDTHAVRVFAGTAEVVANPTATGVMFGPGIIRDVPITILLEAKVLDTAEGSVLVRENRHLAIPSYTVADLAYAYSVDRKSIEPTRYCEPSSILKVTLKPFFSGSYSVSAATTWTSA